MKTDLVNLYKSWKDGSTIFLRFAQKEWEIGIHWLGGRCFFWKGWSNFVEETELEAGDSLVLFTKPLCEANIINACIFKGKDKTMNKDNGNTESANYHYSLYLS